MNEILTIAEHNLKRAREIIEETGIIGIWEYVGASINLVGSVKTGLLMKNKDIDFHIYSDPFRIADSFTAVARLAENRRIGHIEFNNLLDTDEKCLEWHARYRDRGDNLWRIDMIHIMNESPYAGYFETVADRILAVLTPETKEAILSIKHDIPQDEKVMGIEIYQAVIRDGVRTYHEFKQWQKNNHHEGIIDWMP